MNMAASRRAVQAHIGSLAAQRSLTAVRTTSVLLRHPFVRPQSSSQLSQLTNKLIKRTFISTSAGDEANSETRSSEAFDEHPLRQLDGFARRHIGPSPASTEEMLKALDPPVSSIDEFVKQVIPPDVLSSRNLTIGKQWESQKALGEESPALTETSMLKQLMTLAKKNKNLKSLIGMGYAGTNTPEVIKRNILESPGWYTSYTPYQPEISQGRLESLLNYQTMVADLTALPIANASLLDESTAAAEAMTLSLNALPLSRQKAENKTFYVSRLCHPQTIAVLQSRADGFNIKIEVGDVLANNCARVKELGQDLIGCLVQYPDTEGGVEDFRGLGEAIHAQGATFSVATDLLALTVLTPPGEFGADIAFGNSQRFGVPFGYGGPHAAFFAVNDKYKRKIPGRLIGLSKDRLGDNALRLALQTREQHIRREKATSNVCTAQALLANMSAMYAVYHGPAGLKEIAERTIICARTVEAGLRRQGYQTRTKGRGTQGKVLFDTVVVNTTPSQQRVIAELMLQSRMNLRYFNDGRIGITVDETVTTADIKRIFNRFREANNSPLCDMNVAIRDAVKGREEEIPAPLRRTSEYLTHPVFNSHHSETELLRYIHHLQSKDLSLVHSMIPLGSCTMKLNASTQMAPITWPGFSDIHPFAPVNQAAGYKDLIDELEKDLAHITGFDAVSLQPNSGAQGEFTGLRVIRKFHEQQPGPKRDICLIPVSAHGTNPASAAMAGMRVVTIKCDTATGNLNMEDLKAKCEQYSKNLGAIMITYPSTFGVFEPDVKKACDLVHQHGGQVYMDGANMNAQIGLCSPGEIGADVCHLNLHKTFCIPHGGGGPGVGPIGVKAHLQPFLPGHPVVKTGGEHAIAPVSGAPWGSASILPISYSYIKMMGGRGLTHATKITLLNANYIMSRLRPHYDILYTNEAGRCAHEFILDVRPLKETSGVEAIDIAKRLQDYGFHAPTMSWPVANTLMIEPTESESKQELDRFINALISIRKEVKAIEDGKIDRKINPLKMAPHTQKDLLLGEWDRPYTREQAAYPLPYLKEKKFWPSVTRLNDAYGDTNLFCTCGPVEPTDQLEEGGITGVSAPTPT